MQVIGGKHFINWSGGSVIIANDNDICINDQSILLIYGWPLCTLVEGMMQNEAAWMRHDIASLKYRPIS